MGDRLSYLKSRLSGKNIFRMLIFLMNTATVGMCINILVTNNFTNTKTENFYSDGVDKNYLSSMVSSIVDNMNNINKNAIQTNKVSSAIFLLTSPFTYDEYSQTLNLNKTLTTKDMSNYMLKSVYDTKINEINNSMNSLQTIVDNINNTFTDWKNTTSINYKKLSLFTKYNNDYILYSNTLPLTIDYTNTYTFDASGWILSNCANHTASKSCGTPNVPGIWDCYS